MAADLSSNLEYNAYITALVSEIKRERGGYGERIDLSSEKGPSPRGVHAEALPSRQADLYNAWVPQLWPNALAALVVLCSSGLARADSEAVENHLIVADDAFLDVEYDTALEALAMAEAETGATDEQLARILALRGTIFCLQGDLAHARGVYTRLLTLSPGYRLPEEHTPRAAEFLEQVRAETAGPPEIDHSPPRSFRPGEAMEIRAEVRNVTPDHSVRLFFRRRGDRSYSSVDMTLEEGDRFAAAIPAFAALGGDEVGVVEYFIVVAIGDERLANAGTPRRPMSFSVARAQGSGRPDRGHSEADVTSRWWFWTAIGAAAAVALGVGLGLGFGLQTGQPEGAAEVTFHFQSD